MSRMKYLLALCLALAAGPIFAAAPRLDISLAHDSAEEQATRAQLQRLVATYDVSPWLFTRKIVIDERAIPHSHPVLTLHTRHLKDDELLLSTFVHEELHWFLGMHHDAYEAAEAELREMYPTIPVGFPEGSSDEKANYAHLMIGLLQYRADMQLMGELRARQILAFWADDHYTWIYRALLKPDEREKIGKVLRKHGLLPAGTRGGPPLPAIAHSAS